MKTSTLNELAKQFCLDPSFRPVLSPKSAPAFYKEVARLQELLANHTAKLTASVEMGAMPSLQETMAVEREKKGLMTNEKKKAKKASAIEADIPKVSGTKRALDDGEMDAAEIVANSMATLAETTGNPRTKRLGLTEEELESLEKATESERICELWMEKQSVKTKVPSIEEIQRKTADLETMETVAEIVGERMDNRNKPSEWTNSTIDDATSWKTFFDNFQRHLLHKGKSHPRQYISAKLLRTLEFIMKAERPLSEWELLTPVQWLNGVDKLLATHFGWRASIEELTLNFKDDAPNWEEFLENCQSLVSDRSLTLKARKQRVADAIQARGLSYESLQLRELVEDDRVEFQPFLQPVAMILEHLATISKRLQRAKNFKKNQGVEASVSLAVAELKCGNCQNIGHSTKDCQAPTICRICNKTGHLARDCRTGKSKLNQSNINNTRSGNSSLRSRFNNNRNNSSNYNNGHRSQSNSHFSNRFNRNSNDYQRNRNGDSNYRNNSNFQGNRGHFNNNNNRPQQQPSYPARPNMVAFSNEAPPNFQYNNNNLYMPDNNSSNFDYRSNQTPLSNYNSNNRFYDPR